MNSVSHSLPTSAYCQSKVSGFIVYCTQLLCQCCINWNESKKIIILIRKLTVQMCLRVGGKPRIYI